ncbi:hypothetical protein Ddye_020785 [Dipteronia dyeriana]|uniref:Uncharacterized protein n=1 Tax=Dipteronia dyeriana TaxID=168575 RepID=A0AAD9U0D9_9ROSI|nr:hypothetical protein Ddye_020785 [Dipteronia dyeriana]
MSWVTDAKLLLKSEGLYYTIEEGAEATEQDKSTAMVIIRCHLHEDLKAQYLTVMEPKVIWQELKDRFDNQPDVALPNASRGRGRGPYRGCGRGQGRERAYDHSNPVGYNQNIPQKQNVNKIRPDKGKGIQMGLRKMMVYVSDVAGIIIGHVYAVHPNIWLSFINY